MCLAIPGRVIDTYREHDVQMGRVDFGGVLKKVCLEHVPEAAVDDYVLVHVGFALSRIDEAEAMRVFEFLSSMDQLGELGPSDAGNGKSRAAPDVELAEPNADPTGSVRHAPGGPGS